MDGQFMASARTGVTRLDIHTRVPLDSSVAKSGRLPSVATSD